MAWKIELAPMAKKELDKLDPQIGKHILKFMFDRIGKLDDPRSIGEGLTGPDLGKYWRYRVGSYRIICSIEDDRLTVVVVKIGHRSKVYR